MSGTLPTTPGFVSRNLVSVPTVLVSFSQSRIRQVRDLGAHIWEFGAVYPPMKRATIMPIYTFLLRQRGAYGSFQMTIPDMRTPRGVGTGTPLVDGAHTGGTSIATKGWTIATQNIIMEGDLIKFAGHNKVYMVTDDFNSDGSGNQTLTIEPPLVSALSDEESITVVDVPFTVMLKENSLRFDADHRNLYSLSFDVREAL